MKKVLVSLAAMAFATAAHAQLVTNGSFELTSAGVGQDPNNTVLTDWSVAAGPASYTFVFNQSSADGPGSPGEYGNVALWSSVASPDGGNFIGADPDFQNSAISQSISGLTVGKTYAVTFDQAGAQQKGFSGATTEYWAVTLGGVTKDSPTLSNASEGFTGWSSDTLDFTATATTETLSFLSGGTGGAGEPPFALLDGVSLTQVPEPATWAMMLVGFGALGTAIRSRRKQALATA